MRTFSCFITERGSSTPLLSLILAENELRARELLGRELLDAREPTSLEICEGGRILWTEDVQQRPASAGAPGEASDGRRRSSQPWRQLGRQALRKLSRPREAPRGERPRKSA